MENHTSQKKEEKNKYVKEFCAMTTSGYLEDALDAIEKINQEILEASEGEEFHVDDKRAVIEFTDWFYKNANTEELTDAVVKKWPDYPELFHLAGDYTLEGDLKLANQTIEDMNDDQRGFLHQLLKYLWSFDAYCIFNFWAGKQDYFETTIPKKEDFQNKEREKYYKNLVKVWTVRVISTNGTIMFRHERNDGKFGTTGFICRKGSVGIISPEGMKRALCQGGAMSPEQLEKLEFEEVSFQ